jgi:hypothetical protein
MGGVPGRAYPMHCPSIESARTQGIEIIRDDLLTGDLVVFETQSLPSLLRCLAANPESGSDPAISEIPFLEMRFGFVAALFRERGCFCDFGALDLPTADIACCSFGLEAGFLRRASRCLANSLWRK